MSSYGDPEKILEEWKSKKDDQSKAAMLAAIQTMAAELQAIRKELVKLNENMDTRSK